MTENTASKTTPPLKLNSRHQRLIDALLVDSEIQAACKTAGVGRSTAHRWLKDPIFRDELARQQDAVLSEAMASVKTHAARALSELSKLLSTQDDRLRRLICNDLLGHALKVRELQDFESRLSALEKANSKNGRISRT